MNTGGRPMDLNQLQAELAAASILVPGLGLSGSEVFTYDEDGNHQDLPPEAQPVVDAHVPAPRPTEFVGTRPISEVAVTTDDAVLEVLRFGCDVKHLYRANLTISGIDRGTFVSLTQEGRFVWKRPGTGSVPAPGITVVSQIPTTIPTGWATNCVASGTDVVFSVKGPAGRTIDWSLDGSVLVFAPDGLEA